MANEPYGQVRASVVEQNTYESEILATRITEIPSNLHKKLDYDVRTDSNPVYVGFGAKGLATSATGWLLYKLTYDGSDRVTDVSISYDAWDNRSTTAVYE